MKTHFKKTIPLFFFTFLLIGSYSYVCHREYHSSVATAAQSKAEVEESTYQLPDIQALKRILGFVQKLIP